MAAVYSQRFIAVKGLSSTSFNIVPDGYVVVVRDIDTYIGTPTGINGIYFQGHLGQTIWWSEATIGQSQYASWRGRQVFYAGETFAMYADVGALDAYDVTVSGYLLSDV
jgi:hypothetical protein